jgi:hypothetical protein
MCSSKCCVSSSSQYTKVTFRSVCTEVLFGIGMGIFFALMFYWGV